MSLVGVVSIPVFMIAVKRFGPKPKRRIPPVEPLMMSATLEVLSISANMVAHWRRIEKGRCAATY